MTYIKNYEIDKSCLVVMRKGGNWAVYENQAMDAYEFGRLSFLKFGPDCTFQTPPKRYAPQGVPTPWAYVFIGVVDTEKGEVKECKLIDFLGEDPGQDTSQQSADRAQEDDGACEFCKEWCWDSEYGPCREQREKN